MVTAYDGLASQGCDTTYPGVKDLVGLTLVPGVYCADVFTLSGTLTLNGSIFDVWVFKSAATLITSGTANVTLSSGVDPCYVWWWVASSATLGTGTSLAGNILALTSISLATGANLDGRALARNGAVTMDQNTITRPVCLVAPTNTPTNTPTSMPTPVVLPDTGFAPQHGTVLSAQPAEKAYADLGDLWLEIPRLGCSCRLWAYRKRMASGMSPGWAIRPVG